MHFHLPSEDFIVLEGEHSIKIVILSIIIASIASYAALTMNQQANRNSFFHHNIWFFLAAFIMGFGIWSTHFIGMSAYSLPIKMAYDRLLTIFSIVPAMAAAFLAFYIVSLPKRTLQIYLVAGIFMGIGISTMHYLGMIAMETEAIAVYQTSIFMLSIGIAIVISFIALYIFSTLKKHTEKQFTRFFIAVLLGGAISSMHYTGMAAVTFYIPIDHTQSTIGQDNLKMSFITTSVTIGMLILIAFILFSSVVDRYVKQQTNYYDTLTRLPNRRLFEKKLLHATSEKTLAIWHLHNLEKLNRDNSYIFADEVIQQIAFTLLSLKPTSTELFRIEGNRFAFLSNQPHGDKSLIYAMREVASFLKKPIVFNNHEIIIPAVCAWQTANHSKEMNQIYRDVLAVLNDSKLQYNHEIILYDATVHTHTFEQEISNDVEHAMLENELFLVFQPKIHGKTYHMIGVETLLRWHHPKYGLLSPAMFIPALEDSGKMIDVTDWIINQTCKQLKEWKNEGFPVKQVAINIPGNYLTSSRLLKVLKQALKKHQLEAGCLELEITETSFAQTIEEAITAVQILRTEGFSIALDDFGTGVSSLSHLKKIPISTLKIDKSFIDDVPSSEKDSSIIQAIIAIGRSLNLSIVFEGVETKEQIAFLTKTCEAPIIQGYCFAKPMKSDELFDWFNAFQLQYQNQLQST